MKAEGRISDWHGMLRAWTKAELCWDDGIITVCWEPVPPPAIF